MGWTDIQLTNRVLKREMCSSGTPMRGNSYNDLRDLSTKIDPITFTLHFSEVTKQMSNHRQYA
jgi:hypothetical protein